MEPEHKPGEEPTHLTVLLGRFREGDSQAEGELLELVYTELRGLARAVFSGQNPGHTLQPTALVHEAWIKLAGHLGAIHDRQHFFVIAGKAMRQVIANHARAKFADKRGGDAQRISLDTTMADSKDRGVGLVELDDCLNRLAESNGRLAQVAEMRLFSGLSIDEVAELLPVSRRTVVSDWALAKAWLSRELSGLE